MTLFFWFFRFFLKIFLFDKDSKEEKEERKGSGLREMQKRRG